MMKDKVLTKQTVDPDPFVQFTIWYNEHLKAGIAIPDSFSLGTAFLSGRVSVRTVLLKGYSENGFVFFTNYSSKKGAQLSENRFAAMLFYWPESGRQVRIEGTTEMVSRLDSANYFATRERDSQLSAWASDQSSTIPDRLYLEKRYALYKEKFNKKDVELPPHWGGFRIIPDYFEYWLDGEYRLHDRIIYTKTKESWVINRLAP